ncbi:MAG: hypothetical protein IJF84_05515 [Thermoguttaceae bacterium]|nr:hypothetical protein [Thermoguttaceae bacterium]
MITSKFITRQITRISFVLCLFVLSATIYAQNAAPAPKPAQPAPATRPTQPAPAAKPAVEKPLSFRFREVEKESDVERVRNQLSTIFSKGEFENPEDKDALVQYYKDYFFGRWINYGNFYKMETYPETIRKQLRSAKKPADKKRLETALTRWNYPCFIDDFRKDLDRSRSNGEPQKIAVKTAYDFAVEVIASNNVQCTPAIKYNCILLLGNLYYKTTSASSDLPVVYSPAYDLLIKIAAGTKSPRYMKIGAIMSINQIIAETNLTDKQKSDAYNVLLEIVKTKVDPATFASSKDDPAGEGALWTRELAIEGLRLLADFNPKVDKTQGFYPGKEAFVAVIQIINDKKAPMTTRIAALESLGSYNCSKYPEMKANASKLQRAVAALVVEAIQVELDRKVDNLVWGDDAERYSRNYGPDDAANEQVDTTNNAIFLLQRALPAVYAINTALNGVKSDKGWKGLSDLGSADDKARTAEMITALRDANSSLNALSKKIIPSSDSSSVNASDLESEDDETTDKLQEVISVLNTIQDSFRAFIE